MAGKRKDVCTKSLHNILAQMPDIILSVFKRKQSATQNQLATKLNFHFIIYFLIYYMLLVQKCGSANISIKMHFNLTLMSH